MIWGRGNKNIFRKIRHKTRPAHRQNSPTGKSLEPVLLFRWMRLNSSRNPSPPRHAMDRYRGLYHRAGLRATVGRLSCAAGKAGNDLGTTGSEVCQLAIFAASYFDFATGYFDYSDFDYYFGFAAGCFV